MPSFPKEPPFRSQRIRDLAKDCPRCMFCDTPNDGTVVLCHPNGLGMGKGLSQKGHDLGAYGCASCHSLYDGRVKGWSEDEKVNEFYAASWWSMLWLLQNGHLGVK